MHRSLYVLIVVLLCSAFAPQDDSNRYRWDIKIGIDAKGLSMFKKRAGKATIYQISRIPRPAKVGKKDPRTPPEMRKVTIPAYVVGLGKEEDGDYHLVLTSLNASDTMVAEIPDPETPKLAHFSGLRSSYRKAREWVHNNIDDTPPHGVKFLKDDRKVRATLTGYLFFDKTAHGTGHARNGIELHPVLKITN